MNLLFPRIPARILPRILTISLLCGMVAGVYGFVHDQITFALGPEYFTKLKFQQFAWADFGLSPRLFAGWIGILAAGSAGAAAGWFLARLAVPGRSWKEALHRSACGMGLIMAGALFGGVAGAMWAFCGFADLAGWQEAFRPMGVLDMEAFVFVACIHQGGYLGGLGGLLWALWCQRP